MRKEKTTHHSRILSTVDEGQNFAAHEGMSPGSLFHACREERSDGRGRTRSL